MIVIVIVATVRNDENIDDGDDVVIVFDAAAVCDNDYCNDDIVNKL